MTTDKNIELNLEFLDNILMYLVNYASYYTLSFKELYEQINKGRDFKLDHDFNAKGYLISISENNDFLDFTVSDNQKALGEKLVEACYYLRENGFILIDHEFNIKITFQGILKHSFGFVQDYQKGLENDQRLRHVEDIQKVQNRWIIVLTFLIAVGTLVSAVYYISLICSS